jgi:hypothetical protein
VKRVIAFLTPIHRYLGLVFCLIFVIWFASGLVMIYVRMPQYDPAERVSRLAPLDPATIRLTPADALAHAQLGEGPARIVLSTYRSRPVYRFLVAGEWVTVFADDGSVLESLSADAALDIVRDAFPEQRGAAHVVETLDEPDQWSIETSFRSTGPLHVVSLGDSAATSIYVASSTGDIALKTDRTSRFWGYAGPVMHWFYFRPLRVHGPLWANVIVYGSLVGCVLCIVGLVIGLYRYSVSRRLRHGLSSTPYMGWLGWHHYAGLTFGLITLTWVFSGMLSMEPWGVSEDTAPEREQVIAVRGNGIDASRFTVTPQQALAVLRRGPFGSATVQASMTTKELDLIQFMGAPFYRAQAPGGRTLLVTADRGPALKNGFSEAELLVAAGAAMPKTQTREIEWLTTYDSYYYDRAAERPLPVLRIKYADAAGSWLYLAARDGALLQRETARGRRVRWLYHGLHSLDFPGLYQAGWVWNVIIVTLCTGGLLLSMTSVIVGWRFLRRSYTDK